jgi:hypothetical protein
VRCRSPTYRPTRNRSQIQCRQQRRQIALGTGHARFDCVQRAVNNRGNLLLGKVVVIRQLDHLALSDGEALNRLHHGTAQFLVRQAVFQVIRLVPEQRIWRWHGLWLGAPDGPADLPPGNAKQPGSKRRPGVERCQTPLACHRAGGRQEQYSLLRAVIWDEERISLGSSRALRPMRVTQLTKPFSLLAANYRMSTDAEAAIRQQVLSLVAHTLAKRQAAVMGCLGVHSDITRCRATS